MFVTVFCDVKADLQILTNVHLFPKQKQTTFYIYGPLRGMKKNPVPVNGAGHKFRCNSLVVAKTKHFSFNPLLIRGSGS